MMAADDNPEARVPSVDINLGPARDGAALATWKTRLGSLFDIQLPPTARVEDFQVRGRTWQLPSVIMTMVDRSPVELRRSPEFIKHNPVDNLCVYFALSGTISAEFGGRAVEIRAGDVFFQDFTKTINTFASSDYSNATLMFTRNVGPAALRSGSLHGAILRRDDPSTRVLHAQLQTLVAEIDQLTVRAADMFIVALLSVCAAVMERGRDLGSQAGHRLVDRAVNAIQAKIGDPALTPDTIAKEIGVSRAKLYRLLEPYGGPRNLMSRIRLDESLKILATQPSDKIVIADVAFRNGFKSAAQFSTAFRARFGHMPRQVLALRKTNPQAQLYRDWIQARRRQSDFETIDAWLAAVTATTSDET